MRRMTTPWDLLHLTSSVALVTGWALVKFPTRPFLGFFALLQIVWVAWLLISRGQTDPVAIRGIGILRATMSVSVACLFLFLMGSGSRTWFIACTSLAATALSITLIQALRVADRTHAQTDEPSKNALFYANHRDPRILVPRSGLGGVGLTLNFGRLESWLYLLLMVGGPLLVARLIK